MPELGQRRLPLVVGAEDIRTFLHDCMTMMLLFVMVFHRNPATRVGLAEPVDKTLLGDRQCVVKEHDGTSRAQEIFILVLVQVGHTRVDGLQS